MYKRYTKEFKNEIIQRFLKRETFSVSLTTQESLAPPFIDGFLIIKKKTVFQKSLLIIPLMNYKIEFKN